MISATDIDPSPGVPHANAAAYRRSSRQVKTPRRPTSIPVNADKSALRPDAVIHDPEFGSISGAIDYRGVPPDVPTPRGCGISGKDKD
jgi:hypothetical protein